MNASCHTHACVMSHTCMRHVTHMHASCHTHACVMSRMGSVLCDIYGCNTLHHTLQHKEEIVCVLQCVEGCDVVCCSALQCVMQCVAVRDAVCCSVWCSVLHLYRSLCCVLCDIHWCNTVHHTLQHNASHTATQCITHCNTLHRTL